MGQACSWKNYHQWKPRRHDEYAIAYIFPPPLVAFTLTTIDEVVDYLEPEHGVRVLSECLSPLGLCLLKFHSPIGQQAMVYMSPH